MKRLLAAGSGDIYQICPVFRDGERGRWHNPGFTLLEWYRLDFDEHDLADETAALIRAVMEAAQPGARTLPKAVERVSYRDAFRRHGGLNPLTASDDTVVETAVAVLGTGGPLEWTRGDWLDLLGSSRVFPALGRGQVTVLTDFPADQAALARIKDTDPPTAARFEVFVDGVELANGFHELSDSAEQARRFEQENARRRAQGLETVAIDRNLLDALAAGMPDCAGVALGLDRLLALALGQAGIDDVMAFPWERA